MILLKIIHNLNEYYKNNHVKKKLYDYPYYPNVENGNIFYLEIIEFIKSQLNF